MTITFSYILAGDLRKPCYGHCLFGHSVARFTTEPCQLDEGLNGR